MIREFFRRLDQSLPHLFTLWGLTMVTWGLLMIRPDVQNRAVFGLWADGLLIAVGSLQVVLARRMVRHQWAMRHGGARRNTPFVCSWRARALKFVAMRLPYEYRRYIARRLPRLRFSHCGRCELPWYAARPHDTTYSETSICFPLCCACWLELGDATARLPYYQWLVLEVWSEPELWPDIRAAVLNGG